MKTWNIDTTHSSVTFLVRHMLVGRVRGAFNRWSGALAFSEAVPRAGSVTVRIDATSIDTGVAERDAHLRSIDFLDAREHPFITFASTEVEALSPLQLRVTGDLTIRGITREVVLDVEYGGRVRGGDSVERVGFAARTTISRKAFGITFNQVLPTGGLALGDKLEILLDVEAVEKTETVSRSAPAAA